MSGLDRLGGALRVARAEGAAGARARLLERASELRQRRSFRDAAVAEIASAEPAARLYWLPFELSARFGGVALALAARLERESTIGRVALLSRLPRGLRLEVWGGPGAALAWSPAPGDASSLRPETALADAELGRTLDAALRATRASMLRLECLRATPLSTLLEVVSSRPALELELAAHDFALFSARPNLLESPSGNFCGYSRDDRRCRDCLAEIGPVELDYASARRAEARRLLERAARVSFPSEWMRERHRELFSLPLERAVVEPPAVPIRPPRRPRAALSSPRHVAFVGNFAPHKGAALFLELVAAARATPELAPLRWSIFGGGDGDWLLRARRAGGIAIHGFYRPGTLPDLLTRAEVDLALAPSVFPESYGIVLDECRAAGVPVWTTDAGAFPSRADGVAVRSIPLADPAASFIEHALSLLRFDRSSARQA